MNLISKKSAVSRISDLLIIELKGQRIPTWNEVYNAIGDIPSVPAVPLEPLCQWLAGYAAPPNYALQEVITGYEIQPKLPILSVNYRVEAWKLHFMELLKSGLMDTEGEDAEEET